MKKILLLLVFIISNSTNAQYHPMLSNSSWIIHVYPFLGPDPYYDIIAQGTDVVIGSYTYRKIYDPVYDTDLYFREDVDAQKVYQLVDGAEIIVFDFSLQVSDTITFENGVTYTVTSVTTIDVAGATRKAITLNAVLGSEYWIEGVGSVNHPLISHAVWSEPTVSLSCSYQNGVNVYSALNSNCESILKTIEKDRSLAQPTLLPNPFTDRATLTLGKNVSNGALKIFNSVGQLVKEIKNIEGQQIIIERGGLKNGIYILQLFENNKLLCIQKILVD